MPDFKPVREGLQKFTLAQVAEHDKKDDAWIVVRGRVYDITEFIKYHPGWDVGGSVSTVLAIMQGLGTDASEDFGDIHTPSAWQQLPDYYIGDLVASEAEATGPARHRKNTTRIRFPATERQMSVDINAEIRRRNRRRSAGGIVGHALLAAAGVGLVVAGRVLLTSSGDAPTETPKKKRFFLRAAKRT